MTNVIENVTVLTDENGVQREYREIKRKANVGERIKMTDTYGVGYDAGDVFSVRNVDTLGRARFYDNDGDERAAYAHRYVVLEPTDIVIIDGVRCREEKRKAAVGERVLVTKDCGTGRFKRGETYVVNESGVSTVLIKHPQGLNRGRAGLDHGNYVVLTPINDTSADPIAALADLQSEIASLKRRVAELETRLAPTTINVSIPQVTVNGTVDDVAKAIADAVKRELTKMSAQEFVSHAEELLGIGKSPQQPTAQCLRDEIVERAKRDVADLFVIDYAGGKSVDAPGCGHCRVKFVVNREKRTVVALLERTYAGGIYSRGIAKCAPGDVFNAHIGRAIALRRALGLPVPDEYLNAPQPTEVRVGDVVVWKNDRERTEYRITGTDGNGTYDFETEDDVYKGYHYADLRGIVDIIDDSREETEVSA